MFTKELALGCERKDPLCLELFHEAGVMLAKYVAAVSRKAHNVRYIYGFFWLVWEVEEVRGILLGGSSCF